MELCELLTVKTGKVPYMISNRTEIVNYKQATTPSNSEGVGAEGLMAQSYDIKGIFAELAEKMQTGSFLGIDECVTGAEDAWLNTLIHSVSPSHVRFYRPEEIISAAAEYYTLESYSERSNIKKYEVNEQAYEQLESLPVTITEIIEPSVTEGLNVNVKEGVFIFRRV